MSALGVRNIDGFNDRVRSARAAASMQRTVQTGFDRDGSRYEREQLVEPMPYIVVIIDEFADLMMVAGKEIEESVQRLAQKARAAGIHLIMATQRPSVDVITGLIKANFPTRISFKVASKIDTRTILNEQGAEQLLGQGDMLFSAGAGQHQRVHGAFVSDEEVESDRRITCATRASRATSRASPSVRGSARAGGTEARRPGGEGDLYDRAVAIVAARAQGLDQLPAAPPVDRLQPRRRSDRAHGTGGHRRPAAPGAGARFC